jgi:GNAT superfamily N-acetyltransferase
MDKGNIEIRRIVVLGREVEPLVLEAESGGHRFMRRLLDDWTAGTNRFDRPRELLLGAFTGGHLVAIGGLNQDPYQSSGTIGRLRHVYVLANARRRGTGTLLVREIIYKAKAAVSVVRLRTTKNEAAAFYVRLGFTTINDQSATHIIRLSPGVD